jgi:hypothetical protein
MSEARAALIGWAILLVALVCAAVYVQRYLP